MEIINGSRIFFDKQRLHERHELFVIIVHATDPLRLGPSELVVRDTFTFMSLVILV